MTLYPVTVNDATEPKFTAAVIQEVFGKERFQLSPHPMPHLTTSHGCWRLSLALF